MGCCSSRDSQEPSIITPLLKHQQQHEVTLQSNTKKIKNKPVIDPLNCQKEEIQSWNSIIDRTSKKMIDITTYPSMNPLNLDQIQQRHERYNSLLENVQLRPPFSTKRIFILEQQQQDISAVVDILSEARPYYNTKDISNHMLQLKYALKQEIIQHDDVVVPLPEMGRRNRSSSY